MAQSPQSDTATSAIRATHSSRSSHRSRSSIGIEIADSGTRIVAALATNGALTGRSWRRQLGAPPPPDEALTAINALIEQALAWHPDGDERPSSLGVALWGDIDPVRSMTHGMPHNEGWKDFPLADTLANHWEMPVFLASAVAAAGLAEATRGAGQGHRVVLYVHNGRTVASALVEDGAIIAGASGRAGKLAHWLVSPDGPRCACGMRGHLDPIASAQAIVRSVIGLASGSEESTAAMLRISGGRAEAMTVRQVVQLANEGDPAAQTVLESAWDGLALVLANLVATLDPDVIVWGGPSAEAGHGFIRPLRERLALLCGPWRSTPDIVPGTLGRRAPLAGACLLPYERQH